MFAVFVVALLIPASFSLEYKTTPQRMAFKDARAWCQKEGGDLAYTGFDSMETRAQVVQSANLRDLAGFWWGLVQADEEGWQYVNGEPATSEAIHWGKGYPTPDKESSCAYMYVHSGFEYNLYTYNAECDFQLNKGLCQI